MAGTLAMATKLVIKKAGEETEDLTLAHLTSIGGITIESDETDVTTLDSPNRAKEYIQGAKDAGSIDVSYNDMFDGQTPKLQAIFESGDKRDFRILFPDNKGGVKLSGYIASFGNDEITTDGIIARTLTIRLSGLPEAFEGEES